MLVFIESETPSATVHRAKNDGGFEIERHTGLETIIALPEIDCALPLAEVYERVAFAD